jgi:hypothetical protein
MDIPKTLYLPLPYPDLFPRGVIVEVLGVRSTRLVFGRYLGNGGKRWEGRRHRIELPDGHCRHFEAEALRTIGAWQDVGGQLRHWECAQAWKDVGL